MQYPEVLDPDLVGSFDAATNAGGGYVWDAVLEYRVWCQPELGAPNECDDMDYFHPFANYEEAVAFSNGTVGAEPPLALILQREYISEDVPGQYAHIKKARITEWPVEFLSRPRRTARTIPDFLASDAPANRLDILRGIAN